MCGTSRIAEGTLEPLDKKKAITFLCYGFRGPSVEYDGNLYDVAEILNDPHSNSAWYTEPHFEVVVEVRNEVVEICRTFQHRHCMHFSLSSQPFSNLACPVCAQIPLENDFRMKDCRED